MRFISTLLLFLSTLGVSAQTTCVDPLACNFTEFGECEFLDDNGFPCVTEGCAITGACNFDPEADINDGSCEFTSCLGCTDEAACNYDSEAVYLDLSCIYFVDCNGVCGGDWIEDECGNCFEDVGVLEVEYLFSGTSEYFEVPSGVSSIYFEASGAAGYGSGGLGGLVTGFLAVSPGQVLQINVGGQGQGLQGGYNGGGNGGSLIYGRGGAGGGATDIRNNIFVLADRLVVAGGGGGTGGNCGYNSAPGGHGGGLVGQSGCDYSCSSCQWTGSGGTQFNGGQPGDCGAGSGSFGWGGDGGNCEEYGTGGGGGYYGGGGANYEGAGGGSSYTDLSTTQEVSHTQGVRSGNGHLYLMMTGVAPNCELGCAVPQACNFNPEATNDDGSCDFCFCGPGTEYSIDEGQCLVVGGGSDINGDGCTNLNDLLDLLAGYGSCID